MKVKKFELIPADNRKTFYGKCYVEETENEATLYSYGSKIVTLNKKTGELEKFKEYDHGQTTKRHQKAFYKFYEIEEGRK